MIISEKNKITFIAIPKTGTRSVYSILIEHFGGKLLQEHGFKVPAKYEEYYTFTVVRNPYDRLVSAWWSTTQRDGDRYGYVKELKGDTSFLNYCKNLKRFENKIIPHLQPQCNWFNNRIDKIIRYENINEEWLDLPFNTSKQPLPHKNPTTMVASNNSIPRDHYSTYLNDEIISIINQRYNQDFIKFGYDFYTK